MNKLKYILANQGKFKVNTRRTYKLGYRNIINNIKVTSYLSLAVPLFNQTVIIFTFFSHYVYNMYIFHLIEFKLLKKCIRPYTDDVR